MPKIEKPQENKVKSAPAKKAGAGGTGTAHTKPADAQKASDESKGKTRLKPVLAKTATAEVWRAPDSKAATAKKVVLVELGSTLRDVEGGIQEKRQDATEVASPGDAKNKTLNNKAFTELVAARADIPKRHVKALIDAMAKEIGLALRNNIDIKLNGLGKIKVQRNVERADVAFSVVKIRFDTTDGDSGGKTSNDADTEDDA